MSSRAAGLTYEQVQGVVCGNPAMPRVLQATATLVDLMPLREASEWSADIADMIGLRIDRDALEAVWDALDGLLDLCDQRAAGWGADAMRGTAAAVDFVSQFAVPLHAAGAAIGASGLLVEVIGVAATAAIGGTISAVVALCQVLTATGVTNSMRSAAAEWDAADAGDDAKPPSLADLMGGKFRRSDVTLLRPAPSSGAAVDGGGGGGALAVGGLAFLLLLIKVAL